MGNITNANSTAAAPRVSRVRNMDTGPAFCSIGPGGSPEARCEKIRRNVPDSGRFVLTALIARGRSGLRWFDFRVAELLDVHVLEGEHLDVLREPAGGTVHVPHPRVCQRHLEEHVAGLGAGLHVDLVAPVSYTHLRAHETDSYLVCRL